MNFFNNPQYNAIKVVLILLVIVGVAYFVITNINKNFLGVAMVGEGGERSSSRGGDGSSGGGESSSSRPRGSGTSNNGGTTGGTKPPKESTISTIVDNIFGNSVTLKDPDSDTKDQVVPPEEQKITTIVGTTTTNSITISDLDPGTHTFSIVANDPSGNTSPESAPITVKIDGTTSGDTTDPVISSIVTAVSQTSTTITWVTDEVASSIVEYGLTSSYGTQTTEADTSPYVTNHTLTITGLTQNTLYHFRVKSNDVVGNLAVSSDQTFTTQTNPIPTTPSITSSNPVSGSNNNSPKLIGSAPASSTVQLYTSSNCSGTPVVSGSASTFTSSGLTVSVANNSSTNFFASATDSGGKVSECSPKFTYTEVTPPTPDTTKPVISNISVNPSETSAVVTWNTDEPSSSLVLYGLSSGYESDSGAKDVISGVTSHSVTLSGLNTGTLYHLSVSSTDAYNNTAISSDQTFVTDTPQTYQCSDSVDNDGDGLTDLNDSGCSSSSDDNETNDLPSAPVPVNDSGQGDSGSSTNQNTSSCQIYGSPTLLIKYWSKGEEAKDVQQAVNQMEATNPPLVEDGIIGPKSLLGIKTVQSLLGTKVDGLWGKITQGLYETWVGNVCQN